jgi:23S rRNA (pseudouridine1915-N3)-methyltransferase
MKFNLHIDQAKFPKWIYAGFDNYADKFRYPYELVLVEKSLLYKNLIKYSNIDKPFTKPMGHYYIGLDSPSKALDSEQLSNHLQLLSQGFSELHFFIGSAYGHPNNVKSYFDERLSLSSLTFGHQIMIPIMAEVIYRSYTLMIGHPYHK